MNVEIKKLNLHDTDRFIALIRVFEEVFEMDNFKMPNEKYLHKLLEREEFVVFVALSNDIVVGGLTLYIIQQYYSEKPLAYIYDLAVKAHFQRQGIGKNLISGVLDYGRERGMEEVFVQADEEDGYALDFYRSTGGKPEKVVHFNYPLHPR